MRIKKVLSWTCALVLASLAGGLLFAYFYVTDSATLAALVRQEVPRFLPGVRIDLLRVGARLINGECEFRQLTVWQTVNGRTVPLLRTPFLRVSQDVDGLLQGKFSPREVAVAQPTLRITRRTNGSWNLQGLLADPWPLPPLERFPVVRIENGTLELDPGDGRAVALLTKVSVRIEPTPDSRVLSFRGTARGERTFDQVDLEGTYDPDTGRLELTRGDVTRLSIAATLRLLPADYRAIAERCHLTSGDVTVRKAELQYDPGAPHALRYALALGLREGATVGPPALPFALEKVEVDATLADGQLTIERARGQNGKTVVHAEGTLSLDPARDPLDLLVSVDELELDERLRVWTPPDLAPVWEDYEPSGRVDVTTRARREVPGGPLDVATDVVCRDVAGTYRHFPYPVEHVTGTLAITADRIDVNMKTTVQGHLLTCQGRIDQPGPDPLVALDVQSDGLPLNDVLFNALPEEVRPVVLQFHPSGTARGSAHVVRTRSTEADPEGKLAITTDVVFDERGRCAITWDGLPLPITHLTGRLKVAPDHWVFEDMRGRNGVAALSGHGRVDQLDDGLKVGLTLAAQHLAFDQQLYRALPAPWRATWDVLNPVGSSRVSARIDIEPGKPDHYHLEVTPEADTRVQLKFQPVGGAQMTGRPGRVFEMPPMERAAGHFVFDDGQVTMHGVSFLFRGSPVRFPFGTVRVEDGGQFDLRVKDLYVREFRLDSGLRQLMPPVMAQFAQRLDEGRTLTFRTDLALGWDGQPGRPAWCAWENGRVVFTGNRVDAGLPLAHIQGQLDQLQGRFDGADLELTGRIDLASVNVLDQQVTGLTGLLAVGRGKARVTDLQGTMLGGALMGWVVVDLDATPRYGAALKFTNLDLREYNRTQPGKQDVQGLLSGQVALEGTGNDRKTLQGRGEAHLVDADLGELPIALRPFRYLQLTTPLRMPAPTRTAFDSADVNFRIQDGRASLDPIRLTGDAFSLHGRGQVELTDGALDLRLRVLYGRDRFHLGRLSDLMREASGGIFDVHVTGTPTNPRVDPEALPLASDAVRRTLTRARREE